MRAGPSIGRYGFPPWEKIISKIDFISRLISLLNHENNRTKFFLSSGRNGKKTIWFLFWSSFIMSEESPVVANAPQDVEASTSPQDDTQAKDTRNRQGKRWEGGPPRNAERAAGSTFGDLLGRSLLLTLFLLKGHPVLWE